MQVEHDYDHPHYIRKFEKWLKAKGLDIDELTPADRPGLEGQFRYELLRVHGSTDPDEFDILT
jgi:hypothetical protein